MSSVTPSESEPPTTTNTSQSATNPPTTDQTAKATIRNTALELFAESGYDGVSMRDIAKAANVSPALIVHHFGSKAGLKQTVDDYVVNLMVELTNAASDPKTAAKLMQTLHEHQSDTLVYDNPVISDIYDNMDSPWALLGDSPLTSYIRRLLTEDDPTATKALVSWHTSAVQLITTMADAGHMNAGPDPTLRAAVFIAHDLSMLMLRGPLTRILGVDPLSVEGASAWSQEVARLYQGDLFPNLHNHGPDSPDTPTATDSHDTDAPEPTAHQ